MSRMRTLCLLLVAVLNAGAAGGESVTGSGTAFFVTADGWLVTNRHVVEGCDGLEIPGVGPVLETRIDPQADIAALRVEGQIAGQIEAPWRPLVFATTRPRLAAPVMTLGYPLTRYLSDSVSVTEGTLSSLSGIGGDPTFFQMTAPVQPGNSGGPVLDRTGLVIGMATARLDHDDAENVNFAITAARITQFLHARGIGFEERAATVEAARDPSDIAEVAAASTVIVRCLAAEPAPAPQPAPQTATDMIRAAGVDIVGFDLSHFSSDSRHACEASCLATPGCAAYTYNTRARFCFLKTGGAVLLANPIAESGYRPWLADRFVLSSFTILGNRDSAGGDYRLIEETTFVDCYLACEGERRCAGFSFVRASGQCWLKDRIGTVVDRPGVEFGRR